MTDLRNRALGIDETLVSYGGAIAANPLGSFGPPIEDGGTVLRDGIPWKWFAFMSALAFASLAFHAGAAPGNLAGSFALVFGLATMILVPFTIGPVIEHLIGWAWPVLKWLLVAGAIIAFSLPFMSDILAGKAWGAESGVASVYSTRDSGGRPACGPRLNNNALTAAHKSLPCGSKVLVTNHRNGKSVVVTITDRGPFIRGRVIDLTPAGARALGFSGLAPVTLNRV